MSVPWYLLIPFVCAGLYAAGSLCFKQAYARGLGTMQAFTWQNLVGILFFAPLFLTVKEGPAPGEYWKPLVTGALIFCATCTTFVAIRAGDVSLVTPLMGTKVVFTAFLAAGLSQQQLPGALWVAALLTSAGVFVLGWHDLRGGKSNLKVVGWCLLSAVLFAGADVLIGHWAGSFGSEAFLATIFCGIGLVSLALARWQARGIFRIPPASRRWVYLGAGIMNLNTLSMGLCMAASNDPTGVNVVYGTRGMWSIALVWFAGRQWFGNAERDAPAGKMALRLAGALLILVALTVAVVSRI
jgi:drug/metabolite transporter (DMT)-like permease